MEGREDDVSSRKPFPPRRILITSVGLNLEATAALSLIVGPVTPPIVLVPPLGDDPEGVLACGNMCWTGTTPKGFIPLVVSMEGEENPESKAVRVTTFESNCMR